MLRRALAAPLLLLICASLFSAVAFSSSSLFAAAPACPPVAATSPPFTADAPHAAAAAAAAATGDSALDTAPPTMDTVLVKKLLKLEAQLKASEEANAKLRLDASGALKEENRALKNSLLFSEDLAYWSMKLWSESASRRAWEEYACYGPPDGGPNDEKAALAWKGFERLKPKCGCISAPEDVQYTRETCKGRPAEATCEGKTPWVLFAGDSTMRQLFEQSQDALMNLYQCTDPAKLNTTATTLHNARDDEARFTMFKKQGSPYLHEWDSDFVCLDKNQKPVIFISFRSHQGLSPLSKMLSMLRRPHTHRVTASIMPKGWFFNTILPVLDEPYFVEVPWVVERLLGVPETLRQELCGPDFLLAGSALWDTSNWLGSVEAERCGMQGAKGTSEELFPRRVAASLNEACRQFGNQGRFVWRTSNRGNSRFRRMPGLNQIAVSLARSAGFKVFDYESLHGSVGYVIRDHAHPPNFLTMRGTQVWWRYMASSSADTLIAPIATQVIDDIKKRLPEAAAAWSKDQKKLASQEEEAKEIQGTAPWSVN